MNVPLLQIMTEIKFCYLGAFLNNKKKKIKLCVISIPGNWHRVPSDGTEAQTESFPLCHTWNTNIGISRSIVSHMEQKCLGSRSIVSNMEQFAFCFRS